MAKLANELEHHLVLLAAIRQPAALVNYSNAQWELLLRVARRGKLLGYLAARLEQDKLLDKIPLRAANLLRSSLIQAEKQQQTVSWELNRVLWALDNQNIPIIVLKGMAYQLLDLPNAAGRIFADLDLLVAKEDLEQIESALLKKGWQHHALTDYDEHYYRKWSHEIPALLHPERGVEVDVHHTLSSPLGKLEMDALPFRTASIQTEKKSVYTLNPVDLLLHCAINLFQNNELADDLRHLLDFNEILLFFSKQQASFQQRLVERANQLKLGKPLFYSLYFSRLLLHSSVSDQLEKKLKHRPNWLVLGMMHYCVPLALLPQHPERSSKRAAFARLLLYLRSHWLRMPLYRLLPHLIYKSYLVIFPNKPILRGQNG